MEIDRKEHGAYALTDLILEISHFLDEDVINRVETQMLSNRIKQDWSLPKSFQIIETRNKEIGLVLKELEEVAWRMAGIFEEKDLDSLKAMFSIQRNKDYFDRQFYDTDMQSMERFIEEANPYDSRISLLEEWVVRKEEEIKSRLVTPPKSMRKSDQDLNAQIDGKLKKARESIVAKMLETDEFGNKTPEKSYDHLTTNELSRIAESIVARLHLFNGEYPAFMPQALRAVMEHPNLSNADYDKVNTFAKMFELDWRGDRAISNKKEFLSSNPVYLKAKDQSNVVGYGIIGNFELLAMIRQACTPYVEQLAEDLSKASKSSPAEASEAPELQSK